MAQADGVVANGTGSAVRADINGQLAALFTNHSGSTEPATTFAFQTWADTNTNTLKLRNSSNDGWVQLARLDGQFDAKTFNGNVTLNAQSDLRLADSDSSNWVAFQAPATVASNVTWTLPSADGTADQALVTNGSGTLSWADSGGGDNITEGNTSAEVVDTGTDGHFKVVTEGTERLRVGSSGQLGIAGENYGTSGQALLSQGSSSPPQWGDVSADGAFRSAQVFTSSGTWTKPAGLKRVRVFVTGGGGGGGVPATNTNNGGGGAAGGTAIEIIEAASLGSTETVTVGTGGSAGNPGGTGGTSSFGSHCSATGGTGGSSDSTNTGAYVSGGVGSGGNLNLQGQGGEHGNPGNSYGVGGTGGNSYWGGGGHGGTNYDRPHAGAGANGGGGGGGYRTTAGASGSGGNGGAGIVYVEQYF